MGVEADKVVREAERLGRAVKHESSLALSPIIDRQSGIVVPSWRDSRSDRDHPLHSMMSRVGGFPAALARYFVALYTQPGDVVVDPFCGKGTTLLEALRLGRNAAGGDIAPDAVTVSRAKCSRVSVADIANYIESLRISGTTRVTEAPTSVRVFYSKRTLAQLLEVRRQLLDDMGEPKRGRPATFVCGVLLGILHGHARLSLSLPCNQAFAMSPSYVARYAREHGLRRPSRDVRRCLMDKALELLPAPHYFTRSVIREASAETSGTYVRQCFGAADLVLSSPPYLDRQTYVKDAWLRLWFLGRERKEISERSMETGNVITFVESMTSALTQMACYLGQTGRVVLVCGQANIDVAGERRAVKVGDLVMYAMARMRSPVLRVERVIRDRKLMTRGSYFAVHHGKTNGRDGVRHQRYGEDEIIVLRRAR